MYTNIFSDVFSVLDNLDNLGHAKDSSMKFLNNVVSTNYTLKDDSAHYVEIELPGFSRDEISIAIDDQILTVEAKQNDTTFSDLEHCDKTYTCKLNSQNTIVEASLQDGLLKLKFTEPEKTKNTRNIEIK